MSLSARIVLRPSRRVGIGEAVLPIGGLLVATIALVDRWPVFAWPLVVAGILGAIVIGVAVGRKRGRKGHAITLCDRPEVGLMPLYDHVPVDETSWRVVEPTMAWPGFVMLALRADHGARLALPVVDRELTAGDRRALQRFMMWTVRGGSGRGAALAKNP